jgi:hypothetical protein
MSDSLRLEDLGFLYTYVKCLMSTVYCKWQPESKFKHPRVLALHAKYDLSDDGGLMLYTSSWRS